MRALRTLLPLLLLAPALTASKCKKPPKPNPDDLTHGVVNPPSVELQVISIDPDRVDPNRTFSATLFGSAFEDGAQVWVGESLGTGVTVTDENTLAFTGPTLALGRYDVKVRNPNGDTATLRGGLSVETASADVSACQSIRVFFALDSSTLDANAQRELTSKATCFQNVSGQVKIDGHCDERGTTEYNLALGQRRAQAVQHYLVAQGVPPSRIRVISFGEERPLDPGHNEDAWSRNRRAEISVLE